MKPQIRPLLIVFLSILLIPTSFAGSATYQYYRFSQTKLRNNATANSIQLAEMQLFLNATQITGATASNPGGNNPGAEPPAKAVDGDTNTKWLDFNKSALVLNFGSPVTVNGYRWATANDSIDRDPIRWRFEGSTNGSTWTVLDDQTAADFPVPTTRFAYLSTLGFNQVPDAPIVDFTITSGLVTTETAVGVANGTEVTLSWNVTNGSTTQTLDVGAGPQSIAASGSTTHTPSATQIYTLAASNGAGGTSSTVTAFVGSSMLSPVINEFATDADGDSALCDENGDPSDWIEIYNPNDFAIDAGSRYLTDDALMPMRWQIPAGSVIEPQGYLVIFASGKNRAIAGAELHTNFSLSQAGEYLALIASDGSTVADAFSPNYPAQSTNVSYGRVPPVASNTFNFFITPTPNAENDTPPGPPGETVVFLTPPSTFTTASMSVTLSKISPTAEIRYTTNGILPGAESALYTGPITVNASTLVRARVYDAGFAPGKVKAEAYIKIDANVASQTSDLPVVILENFGAGAVPNGVDLQSAYFTLHEPDISTGRTNLAALPTKANRTGIKRRGSSTLDDPKGNYRVEFWQDDSELDKNISLLGMSDHDEWILFAPYNFDRSLVRIPFIHDLSNAIGTYAPRGKLCEVYLNTGGTVNSTDYQGVYVLQERISRGSDRVDIERLTKTDLAEPEVSGGYILSIDRLDGGDLGFRSALNHPALPAIASPQPFFTYIYPKEQNLQPQQGTYIRSYIDNLESALYGANFKDPALGYQAWLDCDASIDHHILVTFTKDPDALRLSTYLYKPRGEKIAFGPIWDFDRTMGCDVDARSASPTGWDPPNETAQFFLYDYWGRLFQDVNFWQKWIDRWQSLRDGEFANAALTARVDALAAQATESQPRNAAKWPAVAPNGGPLSGLGGWPGEIDHLKNWLTQRANWIDTQFVTRPNLAASGQVTVGSVSASPTQGTLYYTSDGSDPRLPGGGIRASAIAISGAGSIPVSATRTIIARDLNGSNWSGPVSATYIVGQPAASANLVVSEIMYHPLDATAAEQLAGFSTASDFEFIEVQNISTEMIDLTGVTVSAAFDFRFSGSNILTLAPGAVALIVRNQAAFEARYDAGLPIAGQWGDPALAGGGKKLSNDGELIVITGVNGTIQSFEYNDAVGWPQRADGLGESLVLTDPNAAPDHALPASWRDSIAPLGTPGVGFADACDEWRAQHFSGANLANPAISGDDADPDNDGIVNFMELALASDPKANSTQRLPTISISALTADVPAPGDYVTVTFTRRTGLSGVSLTPDFSSDLVTWSATGVLMSTTANPDGTETVTYRDAVAWDNDRRFVRLLANKN